MKFDLDCEGHPAEVEISLDGKGAFTATLASKEYGSGAISNGTQEGNHLKGDLLLDGHTAHFSAVLFGNKISGDLTAMRGFFHKRFSGIAVA